MTSHLKALDAAASALAEWNRMHCASEMGYVMEEIEDGNPLHAAIDTLQTFYGGALPHPAIRYWRNLLRHTRDGGGEEDEEPAGIARDMLSQWIDDEITRVKPNPNLAGRSRTAGRPPADEETKKSESECVDRWYEARISGISKAVFASDNKLSPEDLDRLIDRVEARNRRSDK